MDNSQNWIMDNSQNSMVVYFYIFWLFTEVYNDTKHLTASFHQYRFISFCSVICFCETV